mgnify:CR=1 FL=1
MELILDKNKKREHLYLVPLLQGADHGEKAPARKQDALSSKMFAGTKAEPHHH